MLFCFVVKRRSKVQFEVNVTGMYITDTHAQTVAHLPTFSLSLSHTELLSVTFVLLFTVKENNMVILKISVYLHELWHSNVTAVATAACPLDI